MASPLFTRTPRLSSQNAHEEAAKYAPKLPAAEAVPVWITLGRIDEARRVALQYKDKQPELLKMVTEASAGPS